MLGIAGFLQPVLIGLISFCRIFGSEGFCSCRLVPMIHKRNTCLHLLGVSDD